MKKRPRNTRPKRSSPPLVSKSKGSLPSESPAQIRLNRFIAHAGVCSRRDADELIKQGKITVNGKKITTMGYLVKPRDKVTYNGKILNRESLVYVLLNKPKDYITTTRDPQERKTVMRLIAKACTERVVPVGRLDRNTTGLLLFTNDGDLTKKLSHPSSQVKKLYHVYLDKPISRRDFELLQTGLELEDGPVILDDVEVVSADNLQLGMELHSGRNRIVRRIFEHLGYEVMKLDRVMFAGLTKKDLPRGKWRHLSKREIIQLKHLSGT